MKRWRAARAFGACSTLATAILLAGVAFAEPTPVGSSSASVNPTGQAGPQGSAILENSTKPTGTTNPQGSASPPSSASAPVSAGSDASPRADQTATEFVKLCSGCHTIGGGAARAPDLAGVVAWPEEQAAVAVRSMERKVGPLTPQQVDGFVALLRDAAAKERVGAARLAMTQVSVKPTEPADSRLGGAIYFGHVALERGGMPCSSCHRFRGEGGNLAPDLSHFARDIEIEALAGTIERASFPVMRSAYEAHPITSREARHLAAFMKQAKSPRIVAAFANTTAWGIGAGLCGFAIALAYVLGRSGSVRARLIRRATKR